ncbi:MAG: dihydroxyacetone kinase subunit L [Eubacteriales bacterium]|nr:dihydroxyacetone kinase subunit L [Eubacteriales bacterium]
MDKISLADIPEMFEAIAKKMNIVAEELCEMDARMGDGDLGLTMKKGFGALPQIIRELEETDIGKLIMKSGMKMGSIVPSTMGTLMASGLMTGGKALVGRNSIDAIAFSDFLNGFEEGVRKRGKCTRGDRTLLDAIGTASDVCREYLAEHPEASLEEVASIALRGAEQGVEATRRMIPKYGKAAVHKAAANGERDQGACAGMYMIAGIRDYICSNR